MNEKKITIAFTEKELVDLLATCQLRIISAKKSRLHINSLEAITYYNDLITRLTLIVIVLREAK